MTPAVRVVPIAEEHLEGFHAVLDEVARERRYLALTEAPPLTEVRKHVLDNQAAGGPHFVAVSDAQVVGWCDAAPKPRGTLKHTLVVGMGVARSYRGRGIGEALLKATLDKAKAAGFARVELTVRVDNKSAKKLYDKLGFAVEGIMRRHMLIDGEYRDSYLMALLY